MLQMCAAPICAAHHDVCIDHRSRSRRSARLVHVAYMTHMHLTTRKHTPYWQCSLGVENTLFECQCIPGLDGSVALALLRDDLFRVCSGSDHAEAVLLAVFPTGRIPVVAARACVVPFLLDPAAALGRVCPWHMKLRCMDLVAAFLLGVSTAVCTRQPPNASVLARFSLPAWSSVRA